MIQVILNPLDFKTSPVLPEDLNLEHTSCAELLRRTAGAIFTRNANNTMSKSISVYCGKSRKRVVRTGGADYKNVRVRERINQEADSPIIGQ